MYDFFLHKFNDIFTFNFLITNFITRPMIQHIAHLIRNRAAQYGSREAYRFKYSNETDYKSYSWDFFVDRINQISRALLSLGVGFDEKVGIYSDNRPEWTTADVAILSVRGVVVPFYATAARQQIKYIIDETQMKIIFVGNEVQLENALWALENCESLEKVIVFEASTKINNKKCIAWLDFCNLANNDDNNLKLNKILEQAQPDDLATIVYTSGTTGEPKGVMLGHDNFMNLFEYHNTRLDVRDTDVSMCFLPLSHIFERCWTYYIYYRGAVNVYLENPKNIVETLPIVKPNMMCAVPRFFEKMHEGIYAESAKWTSTKKKIFDWSIAVGLKCIEYQENRKEIPFLLKQKRKIADKLVFRKLRLIFGGNIRFTPVAGAAISKDLLKFFHAIGIFATFGYGATETCATVSCFKTDDFDFNTCGTVLEGVNVRISEEGEIQVNGKSVFRGYYKKPEATAKVLVDGWYRTNDKGFITEKGDLVMTDRLDDLFKTSGGKFVSPQKVELLLGQDQFIQQVTIIGEKRNYVTALIVPSFENLRAIAHKFDLKHLEDEKIILQKGIVDFMHSRLEKIQTELAAFERVKKFTLLNKPFSLEDNTLTPSLKIRRKVIAEKYKEIIEKMYKAFD